MDVLSEVLRVVRLEGALFFNAEFSTPWSISSPQSGAIDASVFLAHDSSRASAIFLASRQWHI